MRGSQPVQVSPQFIVLGAEGAVLAVGLAAGLGSAAGWVDGGGVAGAAKAHVVLGAQALGHRQIRAAGNGAVGHGGMLTELYLTVKCILLTGLAN
jgi:hypothetical protein